MYAIVVASVNNVPTSYSTAAGSKIISSSPSGGRFGIINTTSDFIIFTISNHPTKVPDDSISTNTQQYLVAAAPTNGTAAAAFDGLTITKGDNVYIKTNSGSAMTSGKVAVVIW